MKRARSKPKTSSRKKEHVLLTVRRNVEFKTKRTGLEQWEFVHNALPEINFSDISTETIFLSKPLSFPFMISCMTGGYADARRINRNLAEVCEANRIAMGVGSQRQALEDATYHSSFSIVRKVAPSIPIIGNIGAAEVAKLHDASSVQKLADLAHADAFAVHLNPLQEFLQPEGNTNFRGVLRGIEMLVREMAIPIIVKEIGAGISQQVAKQLMDVGVSIIDVAGAGGTSWAGVEILRGKKNSSPTTNERFWDWGISTADAVKQVASLKDSFPSLTVVASGGIKDGLDAAKAIALGADIVGSARPLLQEFFAGGKKGLDLCLKNWIHQFKGTMFLVGAETLGDLRRASLIHHPSHNHDSTELE
jgi:isopentenyl-diphosphate Delta-isomerase